MITELGNIRYTLFLLPMTVNVMFLTLREFGPIIGGRGNAVPTIY